MILGHLWLDQGGIVKSSPGGRTPGAHPQWDGHERCGSSEI